MSPSRLDEVGREWKFPRGTDDRFMKDLGARFQPVMAAVFVLRGKATPRLGCGKSEALSMASASATRQGHVDARDEARGTHSCSWPGTPRVESTVTSPSSVMRPAVNSM